jgi:hypothetical protein
MAPSKITGGNAGRGSHWIRDGKRFRIYERDGWACVWCKRPVAAKATACLDHVLPRALGGGNNASNLVTACLDCNQRRQDMPAISWAYAEADRQLKLDKALLGMITGSIGDLAAATLNRMLEAVTKPLPPVRKAEAAA